MIGAFVSQSAFAMVFDNRYLPLLQRPRMTVDGTRSEFSPNFFATTAKDSLNGQQALIPLGEIYGQFDQVQLAHAIMALGRPNPLPTEFQGEITRLPWVVGGKRQAQGAEFLWNQSIVNWLSTGFSWLFMRVQSRYVLTLNESGIEPAVPLTDGDRILLTDNLYEEFREVCIRQGSVEQAGFGDIDWYLRVGNMWEYMYRFRRIDAGFRLGVLFPTGVTREENLPASIPFGGNGHWGIYGALDGMFELKEDWKVGLLFRVNKRFQKTKCMRVPVEKEPSIFGAVVTDITVNPGPTVILSPYVLFENLRQGLALGVNFTLTWHDKDEYCDPCPDRTVPLNLQSVREYSHWASEYFTINILYDFGKVKIQRDFNPIITFRWDVPSTLFIADGINKTNRVTLGIDFLY